MGKWLAPGFASSVSIVQADLSMGIATGSETVKRFPLGSGEPYDDISRVIDALCDEIFVNVL
jgi:hypothetical protein